MSTVNEFHHKAMDFAALAFREQRYGNDRESLYFFQQAFENECAAIDAMVEPIEPTYSVLHRSAATLALDCKDLRRAEQLAARALAQEPPYTIAQELREVLEQVKFRRHMEEINIELKRDEIQLSLYGPVAGIGFANPKDVFERIESATKLIIRTAERKMGIPFRERGQPERMIREHFQPWISVPRAGSFVIDLKFTSTTGQLSFPDMSITAEVIDEFMGLMETLDILEVAEIQERIPDHAYLSNFLGLAKKIAPDGKNVDKVGLISIGSSGQRSIIITKLASDVPLPPPTEPTFLEPEFVEIQGTLRYADAINRNHKSIRIVDFEGNTHDIRVPPGMMDVIVPSLWELPVVVKGVRADKVIELQEIEEREEG